MLIELDDEYIGEVFEILCTIPFERTSMYDMEPPAKRCAGIEEIIKQLSERIYFTNSDNVDV